MKNDIIHQPSDEMMTYSVRQFPIDVDNALTKYEMRVVQVTTGTAFRHEDPELAQAGVGRMNEWPRLEVRHHDVKIGEFHVYAKLTDTDYDDELKAHIVRYELGVVSSTEYWRKNRCRYGYLIEGREDAAISNIVIEMRKSLKGYRRKHPVQNVTAKQFEAMVLAAT